MKYILGIDGGGSTTRVAICDRKGRLLAMGWAGPSNHNTVGRTQRRHHFAEAITSACSSLGLANLPPLWVWAGIAGVSTDSDRDDCREDLHGAGVPLESVIHISHDLHIAWAGAFALQPGLLLIAGTGSAAYGVDDKGGAVQVGGWGFQIEDHGSGSSIGRRILQVVSREADGRLPAGSVPPSVRDALQFFMEGELSLRAQLRAMSSQTMASLAPQVLSAASNHDPIARKIILEEARELLALVMTLQSRVGQLPLALLGGLWQAADGYYSKVFRSLLRASQPGVQVIRPLLPPWGGALLLALHSSWKDSNLV